MASEHASAWSRRGAVEAFATGAWLGATQVGIAFAMLLGEGASATIYLVLLSTWLTGGLLGTLLGSRPTSRGVDVALCLVPLAAFASARVITARLPFQRVGLVAALFAAASAGACAGHFLASRAGRGLDARRLLLHENNGFVTGFALASALLFATPRAVDWSIALGGGALLFARLRGAR